MNVLIFVYLFPRTLRCWNSLGKCCCPVPTYVPGFHFGIWFLNRIHFHINPICLGILIGVCLIVSKILLLRPLPAFVLHFSWCHLWVPLDAFLLFWLAVPAGRNLFAFLPLGMRLWSLLVCFYVCPDLSPSNGLFW